MPRPRGSMRKATEARDRDAFVGRGHEISVFRDNLVAPVDADRFFVLSIHGAAGIGKSTLLRQLRSIAQDAGMATAGCDETTTDVLKVMHGAAQAFGALDARSFRKFLDKYQEYEKHRHDLEADPKAPSTTAAFLTRAAVKLSLNVVQPVPVVGMVSTAVDPNAVTEQLLHWTTYVRGKFSNQEAKDLILNPVETLTPLFVEGLYAVAEHSDLGLFFDTYERTAPFLDQWLRELVDFRYGDLPDNLVIAIAGQHRLDPNDWGQFAGYTRELALQPFTEAEIREFLARKQIRDDSAVSRIIEGSNGLPLWVALLADYPAQGQEWGEVSGKVVDRALRWEPGDKRQAAVDAALPRSFNLDVIGTIVGDQDRDATLAWLRQRAFVSEHPNGYQYHQVVRASMLRRKRLESALDWTTLHDRLADAAAARRAELLAADADWASEKWRGLVQDEVYHRLCARAETFLPAALGRVIGTFDVDRGATGQWSDVFRQAGVDTEAPELVHFADLLRAAGSDDGWRDLLDALLAVPGLATGDLSRLHAERGLYRYGHGYPESEALADLDKAVEMAPEDPVVVGLRGMAFRTRERYAEALADFDRALELKPDYRDRLTSRGETHRLMGNLDLAIRDFTAALALGDQDIWTFTARGLAYFGTGKPERALRDFQEAHRRKPDDPLAANLVASTMVTLGEPAAAIAILDRLVERFPGEPWLLVNRSNAYGAANRHEDALADLDQVLVQEPDDLAARQLRGRVLRELDRPAEALAEYDTILERTPSPTDRVLALANRGLAHRELGENDKALADLTAALALEPDHVDVLQARAEVLEALNRNEEALADLDRVLAEDATNVAARRLRGSILQDLDRPAEAVSEFTKILALVPHGDALTSVSGRADVVRPSRSPAAPRRPSTWLVAPVRTVWGPAGVLLHEPSPRDRGAGAATTIDFEPGDRLLVLTYRGLAQAELKQLDDALADLTEAVTLQPDDVRVRVVRANVLREMRRPAEALRDVDEALNADASDHAVRQLRADLLRDLDRGEEAIAEYTTIVDGERDRETRFLGLVNRGLTYRDLNRLEAALGDFDAAVVLEPADDELRRYRAGVLRDLDRPEEAVAEYTAALEAEPGEESRFLALANRALAQWDLAHVEAALTDLTTALEIDADHVEVRRLRAKLLREMNRPGDALRDIEHALTLDPANTVLRHMRATTLLDLDQAEQAVSEHTAILDAEPDEEATFLARANRALAHRQLQRYDLALEDIDVAISLAPDHAKVRRDRAGILRDLGRFDEAVTEFTAALEALPEDEENRFLALANRALAYRNLGRHDDALADLDQAVELDPGHAKVRRDRAGTLRALSRADEAVAEYTAALEAEPDDEENRFLALANRALALQNLGRLDAALEDLDRALALEPDHAKVRRDRAGILLDLDRFDEAVTEYTTALETWPEDDENRFLALANRALARWRTMRLDEALADLTEAVAIDPDHAKVRRDHAGVLLDLGRSEEAISGYTAVLEAEPDEEDRFLALANRAVAYRNLRRYDEALTDLTQASALDPASAEIRRLRAGVLLDLDRPGEAVTEYTAVLDAEPDEEDRFLALANRAVAHRDLRNYDEALADFTQAVALDPLHVKARRLRAGVLLDLHRFEEAVAEYTAALEIQPIDEVDRFLAHANRALALWDLSRLDEALADLDAAIVLSPEHAKVRRDRAGVLRDLDRAEEAVAEYTTALEIRPDDEENRFFTFANRALAHRDLRNFDEALADLTEAVAIDPSHAKVHRDRAGVLRDLDRPEEAVAEYTTALETSPDDEENRFLAFANRALAHRDLRNFDEALADLTEAGALDPGNVEVRRLRAGVLRDLDRPEDAVAEFTAALEVRPIDEVDRFLAHANRALALWDLARLDEALADLDAAIVLSPEHAKVRRDRAGVLLDLGRPEEAVAEYTTALGCTQDKPPILLARAQVLVGLDRAADALRDLDDARALAPDTPDLALRRAEVLWTLDRHDDAVAELTTVLDSGPDSGSAFVAHANRGLLYWELDRLDEALADLAAANALEPEDLDVRAHRGAILREAGLPQDADEELTALLDAGPPPELRASVLETRGMARYELRRYEDAIADFDEVTELGPRPLASTFRGAAQLALGRFDEAERDYTRAIELGGESPDLLSDRAYVRWATGDQAGSLADLDRVVELDPDNAEASWARADRLRELYRFDEAEAELDRLDPATADAMAVRAAILHDLGRLDEALRIQGELVEQHPDTPAHLLKRSEWLTEYDRYAEAMADSGRATRLAPDLPEAWFAEGTARSAAGDWPAAHDAFETALSLDPSPEWTAAIRYSQAVAHIDAGRLEDADALIEALLEGPAPYSYAFGLRAERAFKAGRYAEAAIDIERVVSAVPDRDWWFGVRAMIAYRTGNPAAALASARQAIELTRTRHGDRPCPPSTGFNLVQYLLLALDDAAALELGTALLAAGQHRRRLTTTAEELTTLADVLPDPATARALLTQVEAALEEG